MRRNGSDSTKETENKQIDSKQAEKKVIAGKNDLILIIFILLLAAIALFALKMGQKNGAMVTVRIDDYLYGTYPLNEDQTIDIEAVDADGNDFVSQLKISGGKADMTSADCPDQICVDHKPVSHDGETIVCLPHKLVIEVVSEEEASSQDVDIISK